MKFRSYCIVVIGNTHNVLEEIMKISETEPNVLDGKGLLIATFTSASTPRELNEWFRLNKRNFLVFDLSSDVSGYNIMKKDIHDGLFGFLKTLNLDEKSAELLREIHLTSDTKTNKISVKPKREKESYKELTESDIAKMSKDEKKTMLDKYIDNGVEKLTETDKKIMQLLAK